MTLLEGQINTENLMGKSADHVSLPFTSGEGPTCPWGGLYEVLTSFSVAARPAQGLKEVLNHFLKGFKRFKGNKKVVKAFKSF